MKKFAIIFLMEVFNKKDTLTKTITFMALFAAINVVLSLPTIFVPYLSVILIIFLPLTSAIVEVACEDKYFPIYALGTLGLCFAVMFWNIDFAIFYIVPSIVTGYLFGLMVKKHVAPLWSILAATAAQTALSFLFVPLMELITERNFIDDVVAILNLIGFESASKYVILTFFVVSLVQIILSYIATTAELKRFGIEPEKIEKIPSIIPYVIFGIILLSIPAFIIYNGVGILFVALSLFFAFFLVYKFVVEKQVKKLIIFGAAILVNVFVFAIFFPLLADATILFIQFTPAAIAVADLLKI